MTESPEPPPERVRRLAAQPSARLQPQLRIFQPSRHQLRLDFSGDVDHWSTPPVLAAAVSAAEATPRADVLVDLGDVTALYEFALTTFADIGRNAAHYQRSLTFIRLSEAVLRTFDLHRLRMSGPGRNHPYQSTTRIRTEMNFPTNRTERVGLR